MLYDCKKETMQYASTMYLRPLNMIVLVIKLMYLNFVVFVIYTVAYTIKNKQHILKCI